MWANGIGKEGGTWWWKTLARKVCHRLLTPLPTATGKLPVPLPYAGHFTGFFRREPGRARAASVPQISPSSGTGRAAA